jgi:hypothetical protein
MSIKSKLIAGFAAASVALAIAGSASAHDNRMWVTNVTNHTLTNLFASRIADPHYHGDWLGDRELAPGQSMLVDFDDGTGACLMDIKGVFSDHTSVHLRANVCRETQVRFSGN